MPKPLKTVDAPDLSAKVDSIRRQIAELKHARSALENARLTPDETRTNIERLIQYQAARYREVSGSALTHLAHPGVEVHTVDLIRELGTVDGSKAVGDFMCAVFPDQVRKTLERLVLPHADATALPVAARAARLAELGRELLDLERREEALIVQAEHAGIDIDRRADLDNLQVFCGESGACCELMLSALSYWHEQASEVRHKFQADPGSTAIAARLGSTPGVNAVRRG